MKKCLIWILLISLVLVSLTACGDKNPEETAAPAVNGVDGQNGADGVGIIKTEVIDGELWITYSNDPENPVNVGKIASNSIFAGFDSVPTTSSKGLEFTISEDGKGYVLNSIGYCSDTEIVIDTYNGLPVVSIADGAFANMMHITKVTLGQSVKQIGTTIYDSNDSHVGVFENCKGLKTVVMSDNVTAIYGPAFAYCVELSELTLSKNAVLYDNDATYKGIFSGCKKLTSVVIPEGTKVICDYTFDNCTALTSVTIPKSVTTIDNHAFSGCTALTSVKLPDGVTAIDNYAFSGCVALKEITLPASLTSIGYGAFMNCVGLTDIAIPNGTSHIDDLAFQNCSGIKSVTIPKSVTDISHGVFSGCNGLTNITVSAENTQYRSEGNCIIETLSNVLIQGCNVSVIPDSVTAIGNRAFVGFTGIKSINIPENITKIDEYAFNGCRELTSVVIPSGVEEIRSMAFGDCTGLTEIRFEGSAEQWANVAKGNAWNQNTGNYTVKCNDVDVAK